VVPDNGKGWSCRRIFEKYLLGYSNISIQDPYVRSFHQIRSPVEFLRIVNELTRSGKKVTVTLITGVDSNTLRKYKEQIKNLKQVKDSFTKTAKIFTFKINSNQDSYALSITINHGNYG